MERPLGLLSDRLVRVICSPMKDRDDPSVPHLREALHRESTNSRIGIPEHFQEFLDRVQKPSNSARDGGFGHGILSRLHGTRKLRASGSGWAPAETQRL